MRCPICGDSVKSKAKARGWLLEDFKTQRFHYFCHNCGISLSFQNFLKAVDPMVYNDYIADKYVNKIKKPKQADIQVKEAEEFKTDTQKVLMDPLKKLKKVSQLRYDHPVKKYITDRHIPSNQHYRLYYAPKFKTWVNTVMPGKFENTQRDHPRLVIPFIDKDGKCFGVTGRGFDPDGLRYMTIMFEDKPKIFGLDKVDFDKPYKIVEGPIDSLFLDNAIAMAGADGNTDGLDNIDKAVFVFDAEPRNKETYKRMEKIVSKGMSVCIWPDNIMKYGKDINNFIDCGMSQSSIESIIAQNTFSGLEAKLMLMKYKKVGAS